MAIIVLNFIVSSFSQKPNFRTSSLLFFSVLALPGMGMAFLICEILKISLGFILPFSLAIIGSQYLIDDIIRALETRKRKPNQKSSLPTKKETITENVPKIESFGEKGPGL